MVQGSNTRGAKKDPRLCNIKSKSCTFNVQSSRVIKKRFRSLDEKYSERVETRAKWDGGKNTANERTRGGYIDQKKKKKKLVSSPYRNNRSVCMRSMQGSVATTGVCV